MDVRATLILADYAQVAEGKLWIAGGGWSWTGHVDCSFGVGMIFEIPWDRLNEKHRFRMELLDADGQPVNVTQSDGIEQPISVDGEFVGGRAPDHRPGTPLMMPTAMNFNGIQLQPDQRYQWRLSINDESREEWTLAFSTRPAPPEAQAEEG